MSEFLDAHYDVAPNQENREARIARAASVALGFAELKTYFPPPPTAAEYN